VRHPTPTFSNPRRSVLGAASGQRATIHALAGLEKGHAEIITDASITQERDLAALWVLLPTVCHHQELPCL
jgi:hypothetical protein